LLSDKKYILLFHTIHDVLKAEKILKKERVSHELVPVPRNLSSDCGMCVQLKDNLEEVKAHIKDIAISKCFSFDGKTYVELP